MLIYAVGMSVALGLDDPRLRYPTYVAAWFSACLGALMLARSSRSHALWWLAVVAGRAARGVAVGMPPAFSEDVFRYIYEGRVALWGGPWFAFLHPPAEAPHLGVPDTLLDGAWLRINHPELATIYPPIAQAIFTATAGLADVVAAPPLLFLKVLLVACDLGTWALLHRRCREGALLWGLAPLPIFEIAREGHVDVASALGLSIALVAFGSRRPTKGYAGLVGAGLVKLNGFLLVPLALWSERRGAWLLVPGILLAAAPYLAALSASESGLAAYATRWRAGDGAFSVTLALSEWVLGGDWARIALGDRSWTLTRHELARAATAGILVAAYAAVVLRPRLLIPRAGAEPEVHQLGGFLLLLVLLLSPTLHPWYVLWLMPFAALGPFPGRWAASWLAASAVLLHHPGWIELSEGLWRDMPAIRAMVHGPAWLLLALEVGGRPLSDRLRNRGWSRKRFAGTVGPRAP